MFTLTVDWIAFAFIMAAVYTVVTYLISWCFSAFVGAMTLGFQGGGAPNISTGIVLEAYLVCLPPGFIMSMLMQFAHWHWVSALIAGFVAVFVIGKMYEKIKERTGRSH